MSALQPFPLDQPAANGLRRGLTTGTCATAATKAALLRLLCHETCTKVRITLPGGAEFVTVALASVVAEGDTARASVVKDAGDDPDQTHRATITVTIRRNDTGTVRFCRGPGVGVVTQPGLQVPVGEPAINPVPRQMMLQAVHEVLEEGGDNVAPGFDLEVSCENGEAIARRTFNPRLGVVGGISILGTSGIVEPKSLAAFKASIEIYIRVALAEAPDEIVLAPGNLGQRFARQTLNLPVKRVVQMANFIGFSLDYVGETLQAQNQILPRLWLVGHPGKLAKVLDDVWDTHSSKSTTAVAAICRIASVAGLEPALLARCQASNTVEGVSALLAETPAAADIWRAVEREIENAVRPKLANVTELNVRLFQMDGQPLSEPREKIQ